MRMIGMVLRENWNIWKNNPVLVFVTKNNKRRQMAPFFSVCCPHINIQIVKKPSIGLRVITSELKFLVQLPQFISGIQVVYD